ncbi:MAG: hypothetical protein Q9172_004696 [Xanthocarpia lactea]
MLGRALPHPVSNLPPTPFPLKTTSNKHLSQIASQTMSDREQSPGAGGNAEEQPKTEHLNIKVTDNNNEVFFKIKRTTALSKLMNAFCERQGKNLSTVRFLFDGARVNPSDSPDSVSLVFSNPSSSAFVNSDSSIRQRALGLDGGFALLKTRANILSPSFSSTWPMVTL